MASVVSVRCVAVFVLAFAFVGGSARGAGTGALRAADPSWAPDSASIVFDGSLEGKASDIYTIAIDGTGLRNLTPEDPEVNVLPSWGRHVGDIAYETDLSSPQVVTVLYSLVTPDGTGRRDLARSNAIGPIWWSAGDRYLAFDGRFTAETVALTSPMTPARSIAVGASGPWAPRVLRLALGVEKGSNVHLATTSPTGTARRNLTQGRENVRPLAWSRDGRWILFEGSRGGAPGFNLYVIRVTTQRVLRIASRARAGDFSPDGKRIVYAAESGGIYVVSVGGRKPRRITADGANPRWSPDGRWIAFQVGARIDLIHPDATNRRALVGT
jgi:Tol biopolymer transport system component